MSGLVLLGGRSCHSRGHRASARVSAGTRWQVTHSPLPAAVATVAPHSQQCLCWTEGGRGCPTCALVGVSVSASSSCLLPPHWLRLDRPRGGSLGPGPSHRAPVPCYLSLLQPSVLVPQQKLASPAVLFRCSLSAWWCWFCCPGQHGGQRSLGDGACQGQVGRRCGLSWMWGLCVPSSSPAPCPAGRCTVCVGRKTRSSNRYSFSLCVGDRDSSR